MRNKATPELDILFNEIGNYRNGNQFTELLKFIKKFPHMAPYNAMLIHIQKPGSQYVASASVWANTFGRMINPGSRPMVILRPFGPVSFVFDLSDTYGDKPFPAQLLNPFGAEGNIPLGSYNRLIGNLKSDGVLFIEGDLGSTMAGYIETSRKGRVECITRPKKKIFISIIYNMVVNRSHPIETKFATILHELGHLYCGHLGIPRDKWKLWTDRRGQRKNEREFEAESVCWLICERMGIKNPSSQYLSGYLDLDGNIPPISIDTVLRVAGTIELLINQVRKPYDKIVEHIEKLS